MDTIEFKKGDRVIFFWKNRKYGRIGPAVGVVQAYREEHYPKGAGYRVKYKGKIYTVHPAKLCKVTEPKLEVLLGVFKK